MNKLYRAAERAVNQSLRLRPRERFLLVTDTAKLDIAEALAFWAGKAGAETTTYLMTRNPSADRRAHPPPPRGGRTGRRHRLRPRVPGPREALPGLPGQDRQDSLPDR